MTEPTKTRTARQRALQLSRDREQRALALRVGGYAYQDIADVIGLSLGGTHDAVRRAISRSVTTDDVERYRELELERLETLHRVWFPLATNRRSPSIEAAVVVLRVAAARSKLLGLNREPLVDFERQLRAAARASGEDEDEVIAEARATLRQLESGRRGLRLVGAKDGD